MKVGIIAGVLLACAAPLAAQDNSNAQVLHAVDAFLDGLNRGDDVALSRAATADTVLVSQRMHDGQQIVRSTSMAQYLANKGKATDTYREVYWNPAVLVRGNIAVVWAEYSFDFNGKRTHCGVDVFNLMQIGGAWKVTGIQYTVEPDACPKGR